MKSRSEPPSTSAGSERALVVQVATERYALALSGVREVIPAATIVPVPRAPDGIAGVISVRGVITTVIDVARVLGLDGSGAADAPIVLVDVAGEVVGLWVTRVLRVVHDGSEPSSLPAPLDPARLLGRLATLPRG